jgi:hypothetical protein
MTARPKLHRNPVADLALSDGMRVVNRRSGSRGGFCTRNRRANGRAHDFAAPSCAGSRDMGPRDGAIEHLHQMRGLAGLRQDLKARLEHARPAQPPETLPDAVRFTKLPRQRSPCHAVSREIVQCFQKFTVVVTRFGTTRPRRIEDLQNDRQGVFRHFRQAWPAPCWRPRIDSKKS